MRLFSNSTALPAPSARSMAMAALMGATILAGALTAARAAEPLDARQDQAPPGKSTGAVAATSSRGETVEQRIASLHTALKITPAEETQWSAVAQAMRENAAAMEKQVAESRTTPPQSMTAVEDLKTYQKFAQTHVDGLKNLISSFSGLYAAMPDSQKKVADEVFQASNRQRTASN